MIEIGFESKMRVKCIMERVKVTFYIMCNNKMAVGSKVTSIGVRN
jgi:hypothetical protein